MALAQTGPSTSSASKKELVAKALQLQQAGVEGIGNQLAVQTSQQILGSAGQAMGRVPADKRELVGSEIQAEVRKFYEDISPALRNAAIRLAPAIATPKPENPNISHNTAKPPNITSAPSGCLNLSGIRPP